MCDAIAPFPINSIEKMRKHTLLLLLLRKQLIKRKKRRLKKSILFYIERKRHLTRNLVTILPLKSKLFGKFHRYDINRSIEMLKK